MDERVMSKDVLVNTKVEVWVSLSRPRIGPWQ